MWWRRNRKQYPLWVSVGCDNCTFRLVKVITAGIVTWTLIWASQSAPVDTCWTIAVCSATWMITYRLLTLENMYVSSQEKVDLTWSEWGWCLCNYMCVSWDAWYSVYFSRQRSSFKRRLRKRQCKTRQMVSYLIILMHVSNASFLVEVFQGSS